jgi:chromosome segregation protein
MLKALELVGFKSFADRTRFDFPDGITVVVGPNGSGKSNVVDAVKWVLGSQSPKALRGADMADVIFKGSAEGGRKPSNSAEVVLVLDNEKRVFNHDSDEVHVSRRVFRSGDGEYAINGQPCRLKDVKDLFRGTGVGVDAYSLIEQGKVDRLLQASAKDRRGIFEEAAGISRFKAKKLEAERRLQRVDQNLLRLSDIVDEVAKRLATLKGQATKAHRFRELSKTLSTKRTELAWSEYQLFCRQKEALQEQQQESEQSRIELSERWTAIEENAEREKKTLQQMQLALHDLEREYLATQKSVIEAESGHKTAIERVTELALEKGLIEERIVALQERASLSVDEKLLRLQELQSISSEQGIATIALQERESKLAWTQEEIRNLRDQLDSENSLYSKAIETIHELRSHIVARKLHLEQIQLSIEESRKREASLQTELSTFESDSNQLLNNIALAKSRSEAAKAKRSETEVHLKSIRRELFEHQEMLGSHQSKLHGVRERLNVLEQLEDQFAGAGRGGQQLLRLARANQATQGGLPGSNSWNTVRGLVADILSSEMHLAPLMDVALGPLADAIVLSDGQVIDWIHEGNLTIDGRVTLLRLDRLPNRRTGEKIQLDGLRGVIGRADRLTQYPTEYEPLIRALLGTTWFVDSLATALELSHFRGAGLRFVTAECQLIDSDGSITIGSLQAGLGLISRRTEMQTAREDITQLERTVEDAANHSAILQALVVQQETELLSLETDERAAAQEFSRYELQLEAYQQRKGRMLTRYREIGAEIAASLEKIASVESQNREAEKDIASNEAVRIEKDAILFSQRQQWADLQSTLQLQQMEASDQKVLIARLEQRLEGLRLTLEQLQLDATEREKNVEQAQQSLVTIQNKIVALQNAAAEHRNAMTIATESVAVIEVRRTDHVLQIESQNTIANQAIRQCDNVRRQLEKNDDKIQSINAALKLVQEQIVSLVEHYATEYQIQIPINMETSDEAVSDENRREQDVALAEFREKVAAMKNDEQLQSLKHEIEAEVSLLRNELNATGSVNMEALTELDELQSRFDRLSGHQNDLLNAKDGLIKTMNKIDEDSRHLFMETLESIRSNFQTLYRRSFGGGFADILLEDPNDPDSGIEIVATPPGKTTLSNSLLSGGEKALTAVALIMSFFQYRPSPFCILDEVDAPFDEANIGRFVTVLREFLSTTKFIVVTHSKKTMTAANMIYGVTMQENGVSRQVAVRFEEVNDKGEVLTNTKTLAA